MKKFPRILVFEDPIQHFQNILIRWKFYRYQWKIVISSLRQKYPVLGFFTVSEMRFICEQFNSVHNLIQGAGRGLAIHKIRRLTAKFAFMDREVTDEETSEVIRDWEPLRDNELYQNFVRNYIKSHYEMKLQYNDLLNMIAAINLYLEIKEFRDWFETEYMLGEGAQDTMVMRHREVSSDSIDLNFTSKQYAQRFQVYEAEQEKQIEIVARILAGRNANLEAAKKKMDDARELLGKISKEPFDERKKFGKLGRYLSDAFPAPNFQVMNDNCVLCKMLKFRCKMLLKCLSFC